MKIILNNNYTSPKLNKSFSSRLRPVRNFRVVTPKGELLIREVRLKENSFHFSSKISKFFNDNFIEGSTDPIFKEYAKPQMQQQYQENNAQFAKYLRDVFNKDDGHTTLLVALDKKNRIKAAIMGLTFNESKAFKDPRLYSIDSLAVDKKFRGLGIAKILLNRVLACVEKSHTDVVLTGFDKAIPFYKKMGFFLFNPDNKKKQVFYEEIVSKRDDIPRYTKVLTKPLDIEKERFYDRLNVLSVYSKRVKNWFRDNI